MHKGVQQSWMYLVPLALLGLVATCDSDFTIKNPFSKDKEEPAASEPEDTNIAVEEDTVNIPHYSMEDTVKIIGGDEKAPPKKWRIVIGSLAEESQASQLASNVGAGGEVMYVEYLGTYRVVYASYTDLLQAQQAFPEIQQRFPQAWLVYY